jgi:uncharacterized protein (UPF0276 family)
MIPTGVSGAGLGLRRELISDVLAHCPAAIDFFEVAPENWMEMGGASGRQFRALTERHRFVAHGLSLSLGGPGPLDELFLKRVRRFLDAHGITLYPEHLSYTTDEGQLYDLLPIPATGDAVRHVAQRIRRVQDILGRRIAVENASFYVKAPIDEMTEAAFIRAVLEEADCALHLDINNVYVNSINHGYDPREFLLQLPQERVVYVHTAGHYVEAEDLIVDTHGADVIDPVWDLLDFAYGRFGVHPTLLERDFNIPPLSKLMREVKRIATLQRRHVPAARAVRGRAAS